MFEVARELDTKINNYTNFVLLEETHRPATHAKKGCYAITIAPGLGHL